LEDTIAVLTPAGKLQREIALKAKEPTNLAFGGTDGKTVFVTQRQGGFCRSVPGRLSGPRVLFCHLCGSEGTRVNFRYARPGRPDRQNARIKLRFPAKWLFRQAQGPNRPKTHLIQIAGLWCRIVSSPASRRNNSPAHETIFRLACRRPETLAH
jgi:hypothetical protein